MSIKDVTGVSTTPTFPRFPTPPVRRRQHTSPTPHDKRESGRETNSLLQSVKKFISLFLREGERPLFKHQEAYEKLITRTRDPTTTYAPPPSFWPAREPRSFGEWPYLITERPKETISEAPFNDKLLAKLRAPMKGRLMIDTSGVLYLKIPEKVVQSVLKFIHPLNSRFSELDSLELLGSHVRVMMPHETAKLLSHTSIDEIGEEFYFSLQGCFISSSVGKEAWHLAIDCPALEALREKYTGNKKSSTNSSLQALLALKGSQSEPSLMEIAGGNFLVNPAVSPA